jgi:GDPmannose 4,6-dehydratase
MDTIPVGQNNAIVAKKNIGGKVQKFVDGGVAQRKVGYIDSDVLNDPKNKKIVEEQIAKLAAHHLVRIYRDSYGIFASCGILFNHESPRRGTNFVTRKITKYIGDQMKNPSNVKLKLGNLDAYRDWGHAKDYVKAMWLMLQQDVPDDYVVATGETHSVRQFLEHSFGIAGLIISEKVEIDPELYRPCEVEYLKGNPAKALDKLGWKPETSFKELVSDMLYTDMIKK